MAAEDLGHPHAEILEVKHAIRSDTPCTVHGGEDAGYTAQQLKSARSLPHANQLRLWWATTTLVVGYNYAGGRLRLRCWWATTTLVVGYDLGDLQAEILDVKHAIRSHTPCTLCPAAQVRTFSPTCEPRARDTQLHHHHRNASRQRPSAHATTTASAAASFTSSYWLPRRALESQANSQQGRANAISQRQYHQDTYCQRAA